MKIEARFVDFDGYNGSGSGSGSTSTRFDGCVRETHILTNEDIENKGFALRWLLVPDKGDEVWASINGVDQLINTDFCIVNKTDPDTDEIIENDFSWNEYALDDVSLRVGDVVCVEYYGQYSDDEVAAFVGVRDAASDGKIYARRNGTWFEVVIPSIVDNLTSGGSNSSLSAEQGKVLKELIDTKADSSDLTALETTVGGIDTRVTDLENGQIVVVNDLVTQDSGKALSAEQGKVLKSLVDSKADATSVNSLTTTVTNLSANVANLSNSQVSIVNNLTAGGTSNALSAEQGKVLKGLVDGKADTSAVTSLSSTVTSLNTTVTGVKTTLDNFGHWGIAYNVNTYNSDGNPTRITFSDGVVLTLTYNSNGDPTSAVYRQNNVTLKTATFSYNSSNQLIQYALS